MPEKEALDQIKAEQDRLKQIREEEEKLEREKEALVCNDNGQFRVIYNLKRHIPVICLIAVFA